MKRFILASILVWGLFSFVFAAKVHPQNLSVFERKNDSVQNPIGPGVMITIEPNIDYEDSYIRRDAVEVLDKASGAPSPELENDIRFNRDDWAKDVRFSRDIWCLEFRFKPIRMIRVDFPGPNGTVEKKQVWYLLYKVENTGKTLRAVPDPESPHAMPEFTQIEVHRCNDPNCTYCEKIEGAAPKILEVHTPPVLKNQPGTFSPEFIATPIRFYPNFLLVSNNYLVSTKTRVDDETGDFIREEERDVFSIPDRIVPLAVDRIAQRENLTKLETTVSISNRDIQPGESVWGVATWTEEDPRIRKINKFSVLVSGLTNAYRWRDAEEEDEGTIASRTLEENLSQVRQNAANAALLKALRESHLSVQQVVNPQKGVFHQKVLKLNFLRLGDEIDVHERQIRYGDPDAPEGEKEHSWYFRSVDYPE